MDTVEPQQRVGLLIRSNHWAAYKTGEWALIVGTDESKGRPCWNVLFPGGETDDWVCDDPAADYEFKST